MATIKDKGARDYRLVSHGHNKAASLDFNKIRVGKETLQNDVVAQLDFFSQKNNAISADRVKSAIERHNISELRTISNYYFEQSGIYNRLCRYMAFLYRYDWYITPIVYDKKIKKENIVNGWYKASNILEKSNLKKTFGEIALSVIKNGCYYGYKIEQPTRVLLQDLPIDYCRSRYKLNGKPAVEFNIKYFNDTFSDVDYRLRVLKLFPQEFQKAYMAFQNGTLPRDFQGDDTGWFLLDTEKTVKFSLTNSDSPLFIPVIPEIIHLDEAKELDRQKMKQQLLKLIIQKMPIDKNGDLIFDVEEARTLHSNAVGMLSKSIGLNVLTTFADVDVADMSERGTASSVDQLEKIERGLFNESGVSQKQFNTDGNIALEKSIANDEATMLDLLLQFEEYAESLIHSLNKNPKRLEYKVQMLPTTVYNYKDLSKIYKEQTMLGFSKLLPQVALGQSQTSVMATAYFENELMNLDELFVPPQMSSTISGKDSKGDKKAIPSQDEGGRPELPDEQKSEKTLKNIEAEG